MKNYRDYEDNYLAKMFAFEDFSGLIIQNRAFKYDCAKNKVKVHGQYDFVKIVDIAKEKDQEVNQEVLGQLEFWDPVSLTTFDCDKLKANHGVNRVAYGISSKDIAALSFATIHLISSAYVVLTDDEIPLQELLQGIVDKYAA